MDDGVGTAEREATGSHNDPVPNTIVGTLPSAVDPHAGVGHDQSHRTNPSRDNIHPQVEVPILRDPDGDGGVEAGAGHGLLLFGEALLESGSPDALPSGAIKLQIRRIQSRSNLFPLI